MFRRIQRVLLRARPVRRRILLLGTIATLLLAVPVTAATPGKKKPEPPTLAERQKQGEELFHRRWVPRTPKGKSDLGGDGLGPMFNENSCAGCHHLGGSGGAGPSKNNVQIVSIGSIPGDHGDVERTR